MSYILDDRKVILEMFPFMGEYEDVWLDVSKEIIWLEGYTPPYSWWSSSEAKEKINVDSLVEKYHEIKEAIT